jgi:serine protease Do
MTIEVLRLETGEILEGVLNGDDLEVTAVLDTGTDPGDTEPETGEGTPGEDGYVTIYDETGTMSMDVPTSWSDVVSGPWEVNGETVGLSLAAAPDYDSWLSTWGTPGVRLMASADLAGLYSPDEFIAALEGWESDCDTSELFDYDDGMYFGVYELWTGCGDTGASFVRLAANPADGSYLVYVEMIAISEQDFEAAGAVLGSFLVG